jgi:hypothetical protein
VRNRSRTNAVSSAITTVFVLTEVLVIVGDYRNAPPQTPGRVADLRTLSI